ncbi:hydroxyphenylacetyl-CoA thioesterase PaaI [Prescottella agglutinans]|uniref:Hydroxyphenylacetyl-CoA thioesterase PaaI n=1 Tax=Prescottella agglutinans TaxID=1644129 RepID=A0A3S3ZV85_9NOCA|nr:hydroxyphenylacetyl-CoA thioesterase PaaI [Prescottella agglutinans]RVW09075.1 hydroxyphenylacetyl-CoA thioesterase PaaI [Prescottella agglutinans]
MSTVPQPEPLRRAAAMFEGDRASRRLGITITEIVDGAAEGTMTVTDDMLNGHGTCHGGQVFLFADTVFSCACNSRGAMTVAAKADIVFVAPAHAGDVLHARAVEQVAFGRNGIFDVTVTRDDGTVVALFRGHSRALPVALG